MEVPNGEHVYCHECSGEWLRTEHGLSCPTCHSDFVEIIEEQHNDAHPSWDSGHPAFPNDDPAFNFGEDLNVAQRHFSSPDGRISYFSTTVRAPANHHGMDEDPLAPIFRNFNAILQGVANNQRIPNEQTPEPDGLRSPGQQAGFDHPGPPPGLRPRDANRPQGDARPLGNIHDILAMLQDDLQPHATPYAAYQAHVTGRPVGPNPLTLIAQVLGLGRHEDAVYSQEELDRVISELVDQNMNGSGPLPASDDAIQALPKKKVDAEMLGAEGKGECSICMDSVELESEVTILPCKHWFHDTCIAAWLGEHDTCPHCRQGIMASHIANNQQSQQEQQPSQPQNPESAPRPPQAAPGSQENPYVVSGSPQRSSSSNHNRRSSMSYGPLYAGDTGGSPPIRERRRSTRNERGTGLGGWMRFLGGSGH